MMDNSPNKKLIMRKSTANHTQNAETEHLLEDAQVLLTATAHVAEEKVAEARKRLMAAIEKGREAWEGVQEKAVAGAKATDRVIRDNPYRSLGIAVGVGALLGYLISRRGAK